MNLKYLGDALDHWKGSLIQRLSNQGHIIDLHADPLITDDRSWNDEEITVYSNMLNIGKNRILNSSKVFRGNIVGYFSSSYSGDLFLDPDTGIATGQRNYKLVSVGELKSLLNINTNRVVSVYQHNAQGMIMTERVNQVIKHIHKNIPGIFSTSYESATVAMLFLSYNKKRILNVADHHRDMLGPAATRIRHW